jgi:pyruvate dehydrogenase complex dehydrogenase (E1) component
MSTSKTVQELNRELAQKLIEEGRNNPESPYLGKFVGIANGQIVVVADDWDELARQLRQVEPDPGRTFGVDVGCDYDAVHEIWGFF